MFIDEFPIKITIYSEFSEATLNNQMVNCPDCLVISCSTWRWWRYRYQNEQITTCWDVLQPMFWIQSLVSIHRNVLRVLAHAVGFKNYILVVAVWGLGSPNKFDDVVTGLIKDGRFRYFHATVELPRLQKDWKLKSYSKHGNGGSWGYKPSKYGWFIIAIWKWLKMVDDFSIWLGATKYCLDVLDWLLHPFRNWARSAIVLKFRRSGCRRCSATNNTSCAHKMATTIVVRRWGVSWKMGYELTSLDIWMFPKMGVPQNGWSGKSF